MCELTSTLKKKKKAEAGYEWVEHSSKILASKEKATTTTTITIIVIIMYCLKL